MTTMAYFDKGLYARFGDAGVSPAACKAEHTVRVVAYLCNDVGDRVSVLATGIHPNDAVNHAIDYADERVDERFASFAMDEYEAA